MKIRTRITLFVVGAGFIASLLLSLWLIGELFEQPFRILLTSLQEEADRAVQLYAEGFIGQGADEIGVSPAIWLEIQDADSSHMLYDSQLARSVDLEMVRFEESGIIGTIATSAFRNLRYNRNERKTYVARDFDIEYGGRRYRVMAARGMEKLDEEIREIFWVVVCSLLFVVLVLFILGRAVAGKIVRPISRIRELAQKIGDGNLAERVPLGEEQDEVRELAETINGMLDRLQRSFQQQREFLFDTSHELKTPLTTIRLAAQELANGQAVLPEEYALNVDRLESQVLRMERLVKSLLNLSSLEALHNLETRPVDVSALLGDLVENYRFLAEGSGIRIEKRIERGLTLRGDEEKLRRAFSNILDNAIKYNLEEGEGIVEVSAAQRKDGLNVVVRNTGSPVPEGEFENVFRQFYRLEKSRSVEKGGFGLGLAIVKRTVELHGGVIRFYSEKAGAGAMNGVSMVFSSGGVKR